MLRFRSADAYWWRKRLVVVGRRILPAELAVLARELNPLERGSWVNQRSRASGIVELVPVRAPRGSTFRPRREPLPLYVVARLEDIYSRARLRRGCPELVIWRTDHDQVRLVAVQRKGEERRDQMKWSADRRRFVETAWERGIGTTVVEWKFTDDAAERAHEAREMA